MSKYNWKYPTHFSKLQKRLYNLMEKDIQFQLHCAVYEMNSNDGYHGNKLPRYFITIDKEIVFDYPKDFVGTDFLIHYTYAPDVNAISTLIDEYIERSKEEILKPFENDIYGITDILRVCDRRIGRKTLEQIRLNTDNIKIQNIIDKRLKKSK